MAAITQATQPETFQISAFTVKVIRRSGLKNMTLRAQAPGEFRLTCPHRLAKKHILEFLQTRVDWMTAQNDRFDGIKQWLNRSGQAGEKFWYQGRLLTLKDGMTFQSRCLIDIHAEVIWYLWPEERLKNRDQDGSRKQVLPHLRKTFHSHAEELIRARVQHFSQRMQVQPRRLGFRTQRSRWGSCSSSGTVTFNLKLIGAPPEVIDSVVVHELAHLVHLNHSTAFWKLVEQFAPTHAQCDEWLHRHQMELFA